MVAPCHAEKIMSGKHEVLRHILTVLHFGSHKARNIKDNFLVVDRRDALCAGADGSVAKIVKLEHAWRRLDGRNDDGFQVAPFPG